MRSAFHVRAALRVCAALAASSALAACGLLRRSHPATARAVAAAPAPATAPAARAAATVPAARVAAAAAPHRIGVVRVIGHDLRFVLVEVPPSGTVALPGGQLLLCCPAPDGDLAMTATLRVSPERRRPYVVADVVDGEPHVGDTVFLGPTTPPPAANVLPTATAGVLPIALPAPRPAPPKP